MKFIDLFAGIGGFRTGLELNGHECVAYCEIDKYARQSYKAIYDTEGEEELHDITQVTDEQWRKYRGSVDIITGGFPCQAFSIAGNRRGFEDTRGTLFFEIARAIKEIQPSYALLENVKGLFSHDKGRTFGTIIQALDELGYVVEWGLFNSKFWGVPQNRERVFILVTRKDVFKGSKLFDLLKQQTEVTTRLVDVLEDEVDEKFYLSGEKTKKLTDVEHLSPTMNTASEPKVAVLGNTSNTGHDIHDIEGISPTIAARDYKGAKQIAVPVSTPDRQDRQGEIINPLKDKTSNGWHFEQQVYDPKGITRAVKAGGGSGNIPKTILPIIEDTQDPVLGGIYTNDSKKFNRGPLKGLSRTLKADNHDAGVILKQVEEITNKIRPNEEIGITIKENGDIRPHRMDKRKSGISELNINHENNVSHTITTSHSPKIYGVSTNLIIRKLTPLECWRLQGFKDEQFYKAKNAGVSNSQLYKQAGNSVTVNVIEAIAKTL